MLIFDEDYFIRELLTQKPNRTFYKFYTYTWFLYILPKSPQKTCHLIENVGLKLVLNTHSHFIAMHHVCCSFRVMMLLSNMK